MKRMILITIAPAAVFATPAEASTGQFTRALASVSLGSHPSRAWEADDLRR